MTALKHMQTSNDVSRIDIKFVLHLTAAFDRMATTLVHVYMVKMSHCNNILYRGGIKEGRSNR